MNRKTLGAAVLSAALISSMTVPAFAAGGYQDLPQEHWAYESMHVAAEMKIINGIGEGLMGPDMELSWGQYLAMLARSVDSVGYRNAVNAGTSWDVAGYQICREQGLIQEDDFLTVTQDNLSEPITRQDVAALLDRAVPAEVTPEMIYHYVDNYDTSAAQSGLADWDSVGESYQPSVARMYNLEVIQGKEDHSFGGGDILHRADGAVLLIRAMAYRDAWMQGSEQTVTVRILDQNGTPLAEPHTADTQVGTYLWDLIEPLAPEGYTYDNEAMWDRVVVVASLCTDYDVYLRPLTQSEKLYEQLQKGEVTQEQYELKCEGENPSKLMLLFGNTNQDRYANRAESEAHMTTVTVPVWKLQGAQKVSSTMSFSINAALAQDITEIFTEIYNDPEQFPMCDLGGFSWRGDTSRSEHNCGTAIDINYNQNYQVRDGQALVGQFWQPGVNPYSIPEGGSVVRAFQNHGWSWGGNAWCGHSDQTRDYHDYMHFSYLGT